MFQKKDFSKMFCTVFTKRVLFDGFVVIIVLLSAFLVIAAFKYYFVDKPQMDEIYKAVEIDHELGKAREKLESNNTQSSE